MSVSDSDVDSQLPPLRRDCALFLDFDGTLAEIAPRPDQVRVDAGLPGLLERLSRALDGAVAVITGRPLQQIDALLAPLRLPGAGLHGAQLRPLTDAAVQLDDHPDIATARRRLNACKPADDHVWIEDKGAVLSLHFRDAPQAAEASRRAVEAAARGLDVDVMAGKSVYEVRPHGVDKGAAIRLLMSTPVFGGRRPVFAGDDVTDEDGFAVVRSLGGLTVKVGRGDTGAQWRCVNPAALGAWLAREAARLESADANYAATG
ncbi:MAG: trehalose-phosphatase [Gammaproteobacteria bacterium]|nr:trehalose-phosphatase [Gammaproteobacteria bacterium]